MSSIEDALRESQGRDILATENEQSSNNGQLTVDKDDLMLLLMIIQVILLFRISNNENI